MFIKFPEKYKTFHKFHGINIADRAERAIAYNVLCEWVNVLVFSQLNADECFRFYSTSIGGRA